MCILSEMNTCSETKTISLPKPLLELPIAAQGCQIMLE